MTERGVALLVVLWVIVVLTTLAAAFCAMTRAETHATMSFREGAERRLLAEAGIERAVTELFYRAFYKTRQTVLPADVARVDGTAYKGTLGSGAYTYRITEESGRVNINRLNDASGVILDNLLVNRGVPKEQADTIVDSLLDWKDEDELTRLHGAESDYYSSLAEPYKSKDAPFESVEELLMVKGMTPEILYGTDGRPGIFDLLTVRSATDTINVNTAPPEVLAALPGMGREGAAALVSARQASEIRSVKEISDATGVDPVLMAPFVSFSESGTYTIEAAGYRKEGRRRFAVMATVSIQGDTYRYVYYKSPSGTRR